MNSDPYDGIESRRKTRTLRFADAVSAIGRLVGRLPGIASFVSTGKRAEVLSGAVKFFLGFFTARIVIGDTYAPFGTGYVASLAGKRGWIWSAAGAFLGYVTLIGRLDYVKYLVMTIIVGAGCFIIRDFYNEDKLILRPLLSGGACAIIGVIFTYGQAVTANSVLTLLAEILLCAGSALIFHVGLDSGAGENAEDRQKRIFCVFIIAAGVFAALSGIQVFADISVGQVAAVVLILIAAVRSGAMGGAAAGLVCGLIMDLMSSSPPAFTLIYGLSGLSAGLFLRVGRLTGTIAFVFVNAAAVLWTGGKNPDLSALYEAFAGSVLFMVLPERTGAWLDDLFAGAKSSEHESRLRTLMSRRLQSSSSAFADLYHTLNNRAPAVACNIENPADIFRRAGDAVCAKCREAPRCWGKEYHETQNLLNDATAAILRRGCVIREDFSLDFTEKCINLSAYISAVNRELYLFLYRRQFRSVIEENRELLCEQYADVSKLLENQASILKSELTFDSRIEGKLVRYLKNRGMEASVTAYSDTSGRFFVELEGRGLGVLTGNEEQENALLSGQVGRELHLSGQENGHFGCRLFYREKERIHVAVEGAAGKCGSACGISGDRAAFFKTPKGKVYVLFSDGMGSGKDAAAEASNVLRITEKFIRSGIEPELAVRIIASAMVLKNDGRVFATLDMLEIDTVTGDAVFYKCGAAPSYILRGRQVSRISASSLPAGTDNSGADITKTKLDDGDRVVITSDGVSDGEDDGWLIATLYACSSKSAKETAARLLVGAREIGRGEDDMSVIAICVSGCNA